MGIGVVYTPALLSSVPALGDVASSQVAVGVEDGGAKNPVAPEEIMDKEGIDDKDQEQESGPKKSYGSTEAPGEKRVSFTTSTPGFGIGGNN